MKVDVAAICRQALARAESEDRLEAEIERLCRQLYPEQADDVSEAIRQMLTHFADAKQLSTANAARVLADGSATLDLTVRSGGAPPPGLLAEALKDAEPGKPTVRTRVVRHVWTSEDGTPPPEEVMELLRSGGGKRRRVRTVVRLPGGVSLPGWLALVLLLAAALAAGLVVILAAQNGGR